MARDRLTGSRRQAAPEFARSFLTTPLSAIRQMAFE